jgi:hypothetical protein
MVADGKWHYFRANGASFCLSKRSVTEYGYTPMVAIDNTVCKTCLSLLTAHVKEEKNALPCYTK